MKKFKVAFFSVFLGLFIGLISLILQRVLGIVISYIFGPQAAYTWVPIITTIVLGSLLIFVISIPLIRHMKRQRIIRKIENITKPYDRLGRVMSSDQGEYGLAPLEVHFDLWRQGTPVTAKLPVATKSSGKETVNHYALFELKGKKIVPKSVDTTVMGCFVTVYCDLSGMTRFIYVSWKVAHRVFSAANIGYVTTGMTSIAVFVMSYLHSSAEEDWREYLESDLFPLLLYKSKKLGKTNRKFKISNLSIDLLSGEEPVVTNLIYPINSSGDDNGADDIVEALSVMRGLKISTRSRLAIPLDGF